MPTAEFSIGFLTYVANITRDRCKPFTRRRASDSARLRDTFKWSVLDNANTAYFAQSQALAVQSATAGKIRIGDRNHSDSVPYIWESPLSRQSLPSL